MPRVRFTGGDPNVCRQIEGINYPPGAVADVSDYWARVLVENRQAVLVAVDPFPDESASPAPEHRDPTPRKRSRKS